MSQHTRPSDSGWRRLGPGRLGSLSPPATSTPGCAASCWRVGPVVACLVPRVLACATVAGLPPAAGPQSILPAPVLYALRGSSRLSSPY